MTSTDTYRRQQAQITAVLSRDLVRLLRAVFKPANPGPSWQATRTAVAAMIAQQHARSAQLGVEFYRSQRRAAGLGTFTPQLPAALPDEQVLRTVDVTGIGTFQRSLRAGATPSQAVDRTAVTLSGSASRLALDGGRSVVVTAVQDDDAAIGWLRITDADPCPWCLMMASRGAVYHSAASAGAAKNSEFIGDGNFKWHDHCGCTAVPVFDHEDPRLAHADDLYEQWQRVTAGHSGQDAVNTWRRYQEGRSGEEGSSSSPEPARAAAPPTTRQSSRTPASKPEPPLSGDDAYDAAPGRRHESIPDDAASALYGYSGGDYNWVNARLRGGTMPYGTDEAQLADTDAQIAAMRRAFAAVPALAHPVEVLRGVTNPGQVFGPVGSQVGNAFTDAAFTSTSTSETRARHFGQVLVQIHIPAGAKVIAMGREEMELLLPSGSHFRVLSDEMVNGKRRIGLEMVS